MTVIRIYRAYVCLSHSRLATANASNAPLNATFQVKQLPASASPTERSEVLYDVRRMLALRHDQALSQPHDAGNNRQISALQQVPFFLALLHTFAHTLVDR